MPVRVKICGLTTPETVAAAVAAGAAYVGFNFFPPSPRYLDPASAAALALDVPPGVAKVAVTVDADDAALDAILDAVPLDMIQLHGRETLARVTDVRRRYGLPVIKAVGLSEEGDVPALDAYGKVADQLLVEAKAPKGAVLPGGNGLTFDWRLVAGRRWPVPWLLAGGLVPANVAEAIRLTGARQVDVSSGVESAPGVKDDALIRAFIMSASEAGAGPS
jgi:phosphoribosylanthranilate isomerase